MPELPDINLSQNRFPEKITAFRAEIPVHGKFGKPCPDCQTGGRLLADRSLSRLLKDGWPDAL
jgi:formamidopyrimidine-DNA glycosylase